MLVFEVCGCSEGFFVGVSGLGCIAVCCIVSQCAAVCCSVLQCVVLCCSMLQRGVECSRV